MFLHLSVIWFTRGRGCYPSGMLLVYILLLANKWKTLFKFTEILTDTHAKMIVFFVLERLWVDVITTTTWTPCITTTGNTRVTRARRRLCASPRAAATRRSSARTRSTTSSKYNCVYHCIFWLIYIAGDGVGYRLGFRSHSCSSWQLGLESEYDCRSVIAPVSLICMNAHKVSTTRWLLKPPSHIWSTCHRHTAGIRALLATPLRRLALNMLFTIATTSYRPLVHLSEDYFNKRHTPVLRDSWHHFALRQWLRPV